VGHAVSGEKKFDMFGRFDTDHECETDQETARLTNTELPH